MRKLLIIGAIVASATLASTEQNAVWLSAGRDLKNTRSQPDETLLNVGNVQSLAPAWVFEASASVSATPAVEGGAIYFPDWGGRLYRLDAETGSEVWSREISALTGVPRNVSHHSRGIRGEADLRRSGRSQRQGRAGDGGRQDERPAPLDYAGR